MADSESRVSMKSPVASASVVTMVTSLESPVASSSAVTMVTSLNAPPSDVVKAVNQSNEIIPALFALPSESGDTKKLKLCKRVGWLRDGVFTTGFMEINIKEAKEKGIFNQPRQVTLVQEEDSIFQSRVIQGQKSPSCKQLSSLMIRPGMSTVGLINARGEVMPKRITVVKNVPYINHSPGKLVALGKAPSVGTSAKKAETSPNTSADIQNQTKVNEVAKNLSMNKSRRHCISNPKVDKRIPQDSAPGLSKLPDLKSHCKESLLVKDQDVRVRTKQKHDASTGESLSCPVKKRRPEQKYSPRITRAKMKDGISSKTNKLGLPWTDSCSLQSLSNPKLDILKLDIDFSRHHVLQMEGLIQTPCGHTSSEFNYSEQKQITETKQNFSDKSKEAPELYSLLTKDATNKPLGNQTTAQSKNRIVENSQCIPEISNQTTVAVEPEQNTDAVGQSKRLRVKRKFDEACSRSNNRAASKLKYKISGELSSPELSCGELSVTYTKVADPETSRTPKTNPGSSTDHSQHYDTDPFVQNKGEGCSQVSLSGKKNISIQNKRPKGAALDTSDNLTIANSLHGVGVEASSQNNHGISTILPMPPMQSLGRQTTTASQVNPVNFSTCVNSNLELREDSHLGNNSGKPLSTTTIAETNNERSSLPSNSSVDKAFDQASDGFPLLQIDSVYSLSPEEAKRLFPKTSIKKKSELDETNQSPVDTDVNAPISSSTSDPVAKPATEVRLDPLDTSRDLQPSQSKTSGVTVYPRQTGTIETVSSTPCTMLITRPSSSTICNSTNTSTGVHTVQLPPVVCINGQVLKLVSSRLPGKDNKAAQNPSDFIVISQKKVAHNVSQNVTPKPLLVSHLPMQQQSQHHFKAPATSINVTLSTSQTATVLNPSVTRSPVNKSSLFPNISNVPVQSSIRITPLFQHGSFAKCNATSIPKSVMSSVASDVSSSTSAGSVCTSVPSSSSIGSICSTETGTTKELTQQEISTARKYQNISESEVKKNVLITTTQGKKKVISCPSTAEFNTTTSIPTSVMPTVASGVSCSATAGSVCTAVPTSSSGGSVSSTETDTTKKLTQQEIPTASTFQSISESELRRTFLITTTSGKKKLISFPSTADGVHILSKISEKQEYPEVLKHVKNKIHKGKTKDVIVKKTKKVSKQSQRLPRRNGNKNAKKGNSVKIKIDKNPQSDPGETPVARKRTRHKKPSPAKIIAKGPSDPHEKKATTSNVTTQSFGKSLEVTHNKDLGDKCNTSKVTKPSSESDGNPESRPPLPQPKDNHNKRKTVMSSNVHLKGAGLSLVVRKEGSSPETQSNVGKKGRTTATPSNVGKKGALQSSQSNVRKKGRKPATPLNINQKGTTPSSQSNVRKKGRTPSSVGQKGALPSSQTAASRERSTSAIPTNVIKKSRLTSSLADVDRKCNAQATRSRVYRKRNSTSPPTRSSVKQNDNSTFSLSHVNQQSSTPATRSSVNKNDTTMSSLSDVYLTSPSNIFREGRLIHLKKLMKQKEKDIEDMRKLRQLEVRQKLSDPELCDL